MGKLTQCEEVLKHIKTYGSITSYEAFVNYRITRLSGRIFELRRQGYPIVTENETADGTTYARYSLKGERNV